jgi:alkylhydroperoxidase family enzyme
MRQHLGLIGAILPLVLVAIALIGFALTLRNDLTAIKAELDTVQQELSSLAISLENERGIRIESHIDQSRDLGLIANDFTERLNGLSTALAISADQQKTINADHLGFADALREMGEIGILPSGERREYGGYGR